jgi:predicted ABC-type ATPase
MAPRMIVVGGPPGGGKSTTFPVRSFGVDAFNVDERCRELHGSFERIPREVRAWASSECELFVRDHIEGGLDFAVETTMRTSIAVEQARRARARGFTTLLFFMAAEDADIHIQRVRARAFGGGHAAPEVEIRATYVASIAMLPEAIGAFDVVECFDTTANDSAPRWVASARAGEVALRSDPMPAWLKAALGRTAP